jgi:hypothetical protein
MQPDPAARFRFEGGGDVGLEDHRPAFGVEAETPE